MQDIIHAGWHRRAIAVENILHNHGDIKEADAAGQKGRHGDLVGGVEDGGRCVAGLRRRARQAQRGETPVVGRFKVQTADPGQIKWLARRGDPRRPGQCMGDRDAHVGRAELCQSGPVAIFDHRMDDRLRVDQYLDPVEPDREEMGRLDQFQPLVHHRRAVDADLRAHRPVGMRHGLRRRDGAHILITQGAERPAARGQDDAGDIAQAAAGQALENRIMLAVHRQQRRARSGRRLHHQRAGRHQRLLVGQRHRAASLQRSDGGLEARAADDRGHGPVGTRRRGIDQRALTRRRLDTRSGERILERAILGFVRDHGDLRTDRARGGGEASDIAIGGQGNGLIGIGLALDQVQRRHADRSGGAEDGNAPHQAPARTR